MRLRAYLLFERKGSSQDQLLDEIDANLGYLMVVNPSAFISRKVLFFYRIKNFLIN